jgi:hypothetical protein
MRSRVTTFRTSEVVGDASTTVFLAIWRVLCVWHGGCNAYRPMLRPAVNRSAIAVLLITLLLSARFIAASTIPDQTWLRSPAFSDSDDSDEMIRLLWSRSPGTLPTIIVFVRTTSERIVENVPLLCPAPICVPVSCSRAPPAAMSA